MSRLDRLASLIRSEVAEILQRKIGDTRIGFISVTEVEVSKDLAHATIYYSQFGSEEDKKLTRRGLQSATKKVQYELGKRINYLQTMPQIHFRFDDGIERGVSVVEKMRNLTQDDD